MPAPSASAIWSRIVANQGSTFRTVTGLDFTYQVVGNGLRPSRTNRHLSRANFEKALNLAPLDGPADIQHLQGPSYTYAILMDSRVRGEDY